MGYALEPANSRFRPQVDDPLGTPRPKRSRGLLGLGLGVAGCIFAASQLSVLAYIAAFIFGSSESAQVPIEEELTSHSAGVTESSPSIVDRYIPWLGSPTDGSQDRAPASAGFSANSVEQDPEIQSKSEFAREILAKGTAYFDEQGDPLQGREEVLNAARTLSMDPDHKYNTEISELARLVLLQPLEPPGEVSSTDLSRAHGASEWALSLFLDRNPNQQEAVRTAIELISSQEQPAARERLRLVFVQKKPEHELDLNRALGI